MSAFVMCATCCEFCLRESLQFQDFTHNRNSVHTQHANIHRLKQRPRRPDKQITEPRQTHRDRDRVRQHTAAHYNTLQHSNLTATETETEREGKRQRARQRLGQRQR